MKQKHAVKTCLLKVKSGVPQLGLKWLINELIKLINVILSQLYYEY